MSIFKRENSSKWSREFSPHILWYQTKEQSWINAFDYYVNLTKNKTLTVLKCEYYKKSWYY